MGPRRSWNAGQPLRVYVDTSVFGGVHDDEFHAPSERFFAAVRGGAFIVLVSEPLVVEIASAPPIVRGTSEAHRALMEALDTSTEAAAFAEKHLAARVVLPASRVDALHVVTGLGLPRLRGRELELQAPGPTPPESCAFHAVNVLHGSPLIVIRSPVEVIDDEG